MLLGFGPKRWGLAGADRAAPAGPAPTACSGRRCRPGVARCSRGGTAVRATKSGQSRHRGLRRPVIADSKLAVDRAVVETWKRLRDPSMPDTGVARWRSRFYLGFQRADRRSWIDFHDGICNLPSGEREPVVVDQARRGRAVVRRRHLSRLPAPRGRSAGVAAAGPRQQELLVGRDKLSGCPLVLSATTDVGRPGCPVGGAPRSGGQRTTTSPSRRRRAPIRGCGLVTSTAPTTT